MSPSPNRNRVFLSCASAEFGQLRKELFHYLERADCDVKAQEHFSQSEKDTVEKLDDYIRTCAAVIHIVGGEAGAKASPQAVQAYLKASSDFLARRSTLKNLKAALGDCSDLTYTQWEAFLAIHHGVNLWVYKSNAATAQQTHLDRLKLGRRHGESFKTQKDLLGKLIGDLRKIMAFLPLHDQQIPLPVSEKRANQLVGFGLQLELGKAELQTFYDDCAPEGPEYRRTADTAGYAAEPLGHWIVNNLRNAAADTDGFHPLLRLALHQEAKALKAASNAKTKRLRQELTDWIDDVAGGLNIRHLVAEKRQEVEALAARQAERRPVLLVQIAPFSETPDREGQWLFRIAGETYLVKALMILEPVDAEIWGEEILDAERGPEMLTTRDRPGGEEPFEEEELQSLISAWADECSVRHGDQPVSVQVFLPVTLLAEAVDQWRRPGGQWVVGQPVGADHHLVVRSWERAYRGQIPRAEHIQMGRAWRKRWDLVRRGGKTLPAEIITPEELRDKRRLGRLSAKEWALAALTFPLVSGTDSARSILGVGAPVVMWPREPGTEGESDAWRSWRLNYLASSSIGEVCKAVHDTRRKSGDPLAAVISLVYDNPYKLPPDVDNSLQQNDHL